MKAGYHVVFIVGRSAFFGKNFCEVVHGGVLYDGGQVVEDADVQEDVKGGGVGNSGKSVPLNQTHGRCGQDCRHT